MLKDGGFMTRRTDKVSQDEQRKEMTAQKHGTNKRSEKDIFDEKSKQTIDSKWPKKNK